LDREKPSTPPFKSAALPPPSPPLLGTNPTSSSDRKTPSPHSPSSAKGKSLPIVSPPFARGLHLTIHGERGTTKHTAIPGIQLAGKSGTARVAFTAPTHNSWFSGYGPYQKPKYTITVMLNGANGRGKYAAPLAAEVFKKLLKSAE